MSARRGLVLVSGQLAELPQGDSLLDATLASEPVVACTYAATYTGAQLTQETWTGAALIRKVVYTYAGSQLASEVRTVYAADGTTIVGQLTVAYTYTASLLTSATETRNV